MVEVLLTGNPFRSVSSEHILKADATDMEFFWVPKDCVLLTSALSGTVYNVSELSHVAVNTTTTIILNKTEEILSYQHLFLGHPQVIHMLLFVYCLRMTYKERLKHTKIRTEQMLI